MLRKAFVKCLDFFCLCALDLCALKRSLEPIQEWRRRGGGLGLGDLDLPVRYHDDGSKKLNACISLLSHMVYL